MVFFTWVFSGPKWQMSISLRIFTTGWADKNAWDQECFNFLSLDFRVFHNTLKAGSKSKHKVHLHFSWLDDSF